MAKRVEKDELKALLADVQKEVYGLLKGESDVLSKANPEMPEEAPEEESMGAPEESGPPPAAEGSAEAPEASGAAPGEAPGEASGDPQDPAADQGGDMEALKQEYMALGQEDPEMLKAHYLACVEALQAVMGQGGDPGQGAEGPGGAGGPPPPGAGGPPPGGPPPAMKMELGSVMPKGKAQAGADRLASIAPAKKGERMPGPPSGENPTRKHEGDARDQKIHALEKNQEALVKALDTFLGHPLRKAVTGVSAVGKPGTERDAVQLSKAEALTKLRSKIPDPKLKKSDRERINGYALGTINYEGIKDLLN